MRGWAPQNTVQLKCIMNDNNIDSSFSISFLMISKHFLIIFLITLIDNVLERKHSGSILRCCVNIIVDWAAAFMCILLTHISSKLAFPFTQFINFRPNEPIRFSSLYSWKSIKQLAILVTPLRPRTT